MLERLDTASRTLEAALEEYSQTCQTIHDLYVDKHPINTIPHDLATHLAEHLHRIQSLREKLQSTENSVRHSMNTSSSLVPIHAFPLEILVRIFKLVQGGNCIGYCLGRPPKSSALMSTCSHWRQVMINSPTLWTHIDLPIQFGDSMSSQISHAEVYAKRAAQMPLHVHIVERIEGSPKEHSTASASLVPFITSIAPRVQSFTLELRVPLAHRRVLRELFNNCTPGILTTLAANLRIDQTFHLDTKATPKTQMKTLLMDIPKERLEKVYSGMKILRLSHLYPHWTSSAYQGLVELRLQGVLPGEFTESQLVGALRQSPGLRILECPTRPASALNKDVQIEPIPLIDLEVVNLGYNTGLVIEEIVRWLAPGSKPLRLLIMDTGSVGPSLAAFFARSNVTHVCALEYNLGNALHLANYLPCLQSIVLAFWPTASRKSREQSEYGVLDKATSALETIYIFDHHFTGLKALQDVVSLESLRRVIFYRCNIWDMEEFLSGLPTLNPRVSFQVIPDDEPDPVGTWEVFPPRFQ
ncbi:F-box-like domain protein, putative [Rhizoctonia solani AG-3 Rhs1AP]|uniref:F-box-like domain protein, putative n=1 Tax=Rhizoctonia solani AG-3 Rhs1AP TaxID=1086054 RepID=X8J319_9AGAM|nr:F-box-like domain protein, putative [Rhizoctonia solani AG-3 Rhs1AP]